LTSASAGGTYTTVSGLLLRHWPGEEAAVVYVPQSTSTHLVSELASMILQAAARRAMTEEELHLAAAVALSCAADEACNDTELADQVAGALAGLVQAGLMLCTP